MTEQSDQQLDLQFGNLRRAWKTTRAPASLLPKIMASVEDNRMPFRLWDLRWSATVAVVVIVVAIGLTNRHSSELDKPVFNLQGPSLAAINQASGGRPHFSIPGLGTVKSVPILPKTPASPPHMLPEPTSSTHQEYDNEISNQNRIA